MRAPEMHLSGAEVEEFTLGKLDDPVLADVEAHLAVCPACQQHAAQVPGDPFRPEAEELPVVLHVHEVVCEVPAARATDALHRVATVMSTAPAWAEGFPVKVEGFASGRYVKSPFKGAVEVKYLNGRRI